jgi:hypothetical protein
MSNTVVVVPQCTHVKTNGEVCGSPAVSGTGFCYHHSALKTALAKPNGKKPNGGFAPIPFVFPEDRAAMQINFFLLLQAFNERHIDERTYNSMLNMLKAMAKNLGKSGKLTEEKEEEKKKETREERKVPEREEDPTFIPPGPADEVQARLDGKWVGEKQQGGIGDQGIGGRQ